METTLELLRRQYNYRLAERFSWWELNRSDINSCSLVSCSITPLKDKPTYVSQANDLPNSKELFPEYKQIYSQVLQECLKRVDKAFDRFTKPDVTGKRLGKPRFKGKGRYRSFTYPTIKQDCIKDKRINLPKIGQVKLIQHRLLPDGFKIKTATVSLKGDGWYVALSLEDKSVPELSNNIQPTTDNTIGIDVGLNSFLVTSSGEEVTIPRYYRKSANRLAALQQRNAKSQKGSKRRAKLNKRVARLHLRVANQRRDFHHKTVINLLAKYRVVAHEDLNIKNMSARCKPKQDEVGNFIPNGQSRRSGLNKSILDAGWGSFLEILRFKAEKAGLLVVGVNPNGTSQNCSSCGDKVPKTLKDRWHSCPNCGLEIGRDHNSAIAIKKLSECVAGVPERVSGGIIPPEISHPVVATRVAVGHSVKVEKPNARRGKLKREAPTKRLPPL